MKENIFGLLPTFNPADLRPLDVTNRRELRHDKSVYFFLANPSTCAARARMPCPRADSRGGHLRRNRVRHKESALPSGRVEQKSVERNACPTCPVFFT